MEVRVHETPEEVASSAAQHIAASIEAASGRFSLGLAGGSTPRATYLELRRLSPGWEKVDAWLTDERWVPPDHERSNGRLAAESLMDHVDAHFLRPRWSDLIRPEDSAAHYEADLRSVHARRHPDLALLGVGEDGHTASLFPETAALEERSRWFVANDVPQLGETRLTATFPLLWRARQVVVLCVGAAKAEAVARSFRGETPAGRLSESEGEVIWYLDQPAASQLS